VDAFSQRRNRIAGRCPLVCASQRDTTSISGFARQESRLSHAVLKLPPSLVTLHEPPSRRTMLLTEVRLRTIEPEVAFGSLASFWHAPPCLLVLPSLSLPPLEFCFGASPTQAEKSRPHRKALESAMPTTRAVANAGPTPGIASRRLLVAPPAAQRMCAALRLDSTTSTDQRLSAREDRSCPSKSLE
jgi:hypothetical protein